MKCRANGANGLPITVALMASVHANRPWQSRPAVPAMRCSGSCYKANDAAGRIAATLVLMQHNENGRICVGGLGPDAGSVWRRPSASDLMRGTNRVRRVHQMQ